jgi:tetratricopeptide (TPR) repeat protein
MQQARVEAHAAIDRALKLDPTLADAHATLGRVLFELDWNWDAAQREINQAIALEPGNAEFYRLAGYLALIQGRFDVALAMMNKAVALDPLQAWNHLVTGYVTYRMGDFPVAEGSFRKALALNPGSGKFHYVLGALLLVRGLPAAALAEMQLETDDGFRQCGLPLALDALGRRPEADQALALAEKNFGDRKPYLIALIYAARHDIDLSFAWLDRAVRQRDGDLIFIKGEPLVRNLLPDPRYRQLMRTMNLPD